MPTERSVGKPTTRRYSFEEKQVSVSLGVHLRR